MTGALVILAVILVCFPIYWMVLVSLRTTVFDGAFRVFPTDLSFGAYVTIFTEFPFLRWFLNTLYVAVGCTVVSLVLGLPAAYALSRYRMRIKGGIEVFVLASQMLPIALLIIPFYVLWNQVGLLETLNGLLLANVAICLPVSIWMLRGFLDAVPLEVEEAARIDGCNRVQALWYVIAPVARSGIIATGIFCFVEAWTEYLLAITLVTNSADLVLTAGLAREMFEEFSLRWNLLMAGSVVASIPVVLLIVPLQRQLVRGLTAGALKG